MNIKADIDNIETIIVGLISSNTHNFGKVEEVIADLQSAATELIDDHTTCMVTDSFWVAQSLSDSLSITAALTVCHRPTEYDGSGDAFRLSDNQLHPLLSPHLISANGGETMFNIGFLILYFFIIGTLAGVVTFMLEHLL